MAISNIEKRSSWYDSYDENGKKYKTLSNMIVSIVWVSSNGFLIKRSSWLDTYDRSGKKLIHVQLKL